MDPRKTETRPVSLRPSLLRLGFGCSVVLDKIDERESVRLIETAIDCGITHFDTAPLYGSGEAEATLGKVLAGRRDRVAIATKAGILPPSRSAATKLLSRSVGLLHRIAPPLKSHIRRPAALMPRAGVFDPLRIQKSIETSLRKLRTDYIDMLLLHECIEGDLSNDLLDVLQRLRQEGKIRAFGLATSINETLKITKSRPQFSDVLQIVSNIWSMNIRRLPSNANSLTIVHSVLSSRFQELTRRLLFDEALAAEWRSELDIDPRDKTALAELLLAHAMHFNENGIVLFSSRNPEHVKSSVKSISDGKFPCNQIDRLDALIRNKELGLLLKESHQDYLRVS